MGYFKGDGMYKLWGIKVYCNLPTIFKWRALLYDSTLVMRHKARI